MLQAIARPFWNVEERRVRALWRMIAHFAALSLSLFLVGQAASAWPPSTGFWFAIQAFVGIAVTFLAARLLDRRRFGDLGLRPRRGYAGDVAIGTTIGAACMFAIAVVEDSCGWATYAPGRVDVAGLESMLPALGSTLSVFVGVAVFEELLFRGYYLTNLAEGLASRGATSHRVAAVVAVFVSSLTFGLAHATNPSVTPLAVTLIAFGGVLLAVGYVMQGDLAIPIGVHLGWNFFQNALDMPVSGQTQLGRIGLVIRTETGPDVITGGAFGPEGGVTGAFAMLLGIALTIGWVRARTGRTRIVARFGASPTSLLSSTSPTSGPSSTVPPCAVSGAELGA